MGLLLAQGACGEFPEVVFQGQPEVAYQHNDRIITLSKNRQDDYGSRMPNHLANNPLPSNRLEMHLFEVELRSLMQQLSMQAGSILLRTRFFSGHSVC